jgi:hypothetical protein
VTGQPKEEAVSWWRRLLGIQPCPPAALKGAWFLADENDVRCRADMEEVRAYMRAIEAVFRDHFSSLPPGPGQDLLLRCTISPGGKAEMPVVTPADALLDLDVLEGLYRRLFALPVPPVREGTVAFPMVFALWGGSGGQPFGV